MPTSCSVLLKAENGFLCNMYKEQGNLVSLCKTQNGICHLEMRTKAMGSRTLLKTLACKINIFVEDLKSHTNSQPLKREFQFPLPQNKINNKMFPIAMSHKHRQPSRNIF
ncbi:hypothetical protein KIL84_017329 [Mauremys mutica]|uniref:Uncharacterized protein n=1 Tax=Mauremys mutica TaxID=74926 RepID=A0A9D4AYJ8_9SAUR|nr:hypothetical protein KIL84_017329 [Mauremys mutica]